MSIFLRVKGACGVNRGGAWAKGRSEEEASQLGVAVANNIMRKGWFLMLQTRNYHPTPS